jgi:histidinol-phosphate aminotransferase
MERVRDPFNVNILAQAAATEALGDKEFLKNTLKHVETEKVFLYSAFRRMGIDYIRSATNFILFDIKTDCVKAFEKMLKGGVIVRDMKAWGLNTFLRVTVGTRKENRRFVETLKKVLDTTGDKA